MGDTTATLGIAFESIGADKVKRDLKDVQQQSKETTSEITKGAEQVRTKMGINTQWSASEQKVVEQLLREAAAAKLSGEALAVFNAQQAAGVAAGSANATAIAALAAETYRAAQAARTGGAATEAYSFSLRDLSRSARGANVALREMGVSFGEIRAISTLARAGIVGIGAAAVVGFAGLLAVLEDVNAKAKIAQQSLSSLFGDKTAGSRTFDELNKDAQELGTTAGKLAPAFESVYSAIAGDKASKALEMMNRLKEIGFKFVSGTDAQDFIAGMTKNLPQLIKDVQEAAKFFELLGDSAVAAQQKAAGLQNLIPKDQAGQIEASKTALKALIDIFRASGQDIDKATAEAQKFIETIKKAGLDAKTFDALPRVAQEAIANAFGQTGKDAAARFSAALAAGDGLGFKTVISELIKNADEFKKLEIPHTIQDSWKQLENAIRGALEEVAKAAGFDSISKFIESMGKSVAEFVASGNARKLGEDIKFIADQLGRLQSLGSGNPIMDSIRQSGSNFTDSIGDSFKRPSTLRAERSTQGFDEAGFSNLDDDLNKAKAAATALANPLDQVDAAMEKLAPATDSVAPALTSMAAAVDPLATSAPAAATGTDQLNTAVGSLGPAAMSAGQAVQQAVDQIRAAAAAAKSAGGGGGNDNIVVDVGNNALGGYYRIPGSGAMDLTGTVHGGETVSIMPAGTGSQTVAIPPEITQGGATSAPYDSGYSGLVDAHGAPVPNSAPFYLAAGGSAPGQGNFGINLPNPNYGSTGGTSGGSNPYAGFLGNFMSYGLGGSAHGGGGGGRGGGGRGGGGGGGSGDYGSSYSGSAVGGFGRGSGSVFRGPAASAKPNIGAGGFSGMSGFRSSEDYANTGFNLNQFISDYYGSDTTGSDSGMGASYDFGGPDVAASDTGIYSPYDNSYFNDTFANFGQDSTAGSGGGTSYAPSYDSNYDYNNYYPNDYVDGGGYAEGGTMQVPWGGGRDTKRLGMNVTGGEMVNVSRPHGIEPIEIGSAGGKSGNGEYHFHFYGDAAQQVSNNSPSRLAMRRFVQRSLNG